MVFPALTLRSGDNVLDADAGGAKPRLRLLNASGLPGSVVGIDCLRCVSRHGACGRACRSLANLTFVEADVQTYAFEPVYDFCFSRFGTQFFEKPGCWLAQYALSAQARWNHDHDCLARARRQPVADAVEGSRVALPAAGEGARRNLRTGAVFDGGHRGRDPAVADRGYSNVRFERIDAKVMVGRDVDEAVAFQLAIGACG